MNTTRLLLLSHKQLETETKNTKAYDGYSDDDMMEHFINQNGYNPVEELERVENELFYLLIIKNNLELQVLKLKELDFFKELDQMKDFEKDLRRIFHKDTNKELIVSYILSKIYK